MLVPQPLSELKLEFGILGSTERLNCLLLKTIETRAGAIQCPQYGKGDRQDNKIGQHFHWRRPSFQRKPVSTVRCCA
jgi:hypothetical protein